MKATVQAGTRSKAPRVRHMLQDDAATLSRKDIRQIRDEQDENGVHRVRLWQSVERKGALNGQPYVITTTTYLDGGEVRVSTAGKFEQKKVSPMTTVVPARTKDTMDFGRLTTAAKTLAVSMSKYGPENPPSPEQVTAFIVGYQNLLEFRRAVRARMTQAEGEIDMVENVLRQFL